MHLCENVPRTNLYKRMSGYQVTQINWSGECFGCAEDVGLLFLLERDAEMSEKYSWFGMKLVETNGKDWIKQYKPRYLFGIKH